MEKRSAEQRLFGDTTRPDEVPINPNPGFLRAAMVRAKEATEPVIADWAQAEKSGVSLLNPKEIGQFYAYVRSSLKSDSDLRQRADLIMRQRIADPDRIVQEVQQAYGNQGIGRSTADKVSEQKRDEKIMAAVARPILAKLAQALDIAAIPLTHTDELIRNITPGLMHPPAFVSEYEPSARLRVSVLPTLSRAQGQALLARFDEATTAVIMPGYADMVKGSALPGLIRPDVSALTLNDAITRQDSVFAWAAVIGARNMYSVFYNTLSWLQRSTLISFSGSITAEAKSRQIDEWQSSHTGRRQTALSFTALTAASYSAHHPFGQADAVGSAEQLIMPSVEPAKPDPYDTRGTLWERGYQSGG